jgi:hypothetical protein
MKVGAYTIAAQPTAPTRVSVAVTAAGAEDTLGRIIVVGLDVRGYSVTDSIVPVAGSTVLGTVYFASITSITGTGWVIAEGNDTIVVGCPADVGFNCEGQCVSVYVVTGNVWIDPIDIAVADATSLPLIAGDSVEMLTVKTNLSLISDGSGATFYAIIWDEKFN